MKKAGFKKYDSAYKRAESPFTKYVSDAQRKAIWASKNEKKSAMKKVDKKALNEVSKELKKASRTHAGQANKIQSAMKKISASCKAQAKKKFKVWPSAYASGWGLRCTRGDFKKK